MRVAAAEGAAPAERGGDAGAGWRELRGGARGAGPKTGPTPGAGAAGARRGVASSWSGVGGRGGCGERLAGERVGDSELGSGTAGGQRCIGAVRAGGRRCSPDREKKEAGGPGKVGGGSGTGCVSSGGGGSACACGYRPSLPVTNSRAGPGKAAGRQSSPPLAPPARGAAGGPARG